jgi:hypothetical protein
MRARVASSLLALATTNACTEKVCTADGERMTCPYTVPPDVLADSLNDDESI